MTRSELAEWIEQLRAWGPVRYSEELAKALRALGDRDRAEVLAAV